MTWTSVIALSYWIAQRRKVGVTSPLFVLGLLSVLYFGLGGLLYEKIRVINEVVEWRISTYVLVINIAIILGFELSRKKIIRVSFQPRTPKIIWLLFLIPCLLVFPIWIIKGGGPSYFLLNRTQKFAIYNQATFFVLIETIIYFINAVLVIRRGKVNGLTYFLVFWAFIHASRHGIMMSLAPVVYKYIKGMKSGRALVFGLLGGFLLFFSKSFLTKTLNISETDEIVQIGELINWKRNYYAIASGNKQLSDMPNPISTNLLGFVSPKVPKEKVLSDWFMMKFHPIEYSNGNKYGFNPFSEYERIGGVVLMFFYWLIIVIILNKLHTNNNYVAQAMYVVIILSSYKLFRSESYNFNRFILWYVFYVYLSVHFLHSLLVLKNRES